jgi:putative hemolysin
MLYVELAVVALLIIVNGLLAMSELAVVSSRPVRLKALAERGVNGARRALALNADPGRFLSVVQIGITLVGVVSGAFSGATLGLRLTDWLELKGVPADIAEALGVGCVVALITYVSLIAGELVPKQIALRDPEAIALKIAPAMTVLSKVASPLVSLLDASGKGLLWLLRQHEEPAKKVTDEEIKAIVAEAESAGVLEKDEQRMISGVMRLGDRPVKGIMTPRTDVDWIDIGKSDDEIHSILAETKHSTLPVGEGIDTMIGVVQSRDLLAAMLKGEALNVRSYMHSAPIVYDNAEALDVLSILKAADVAMALVHDEYGHFEGVVTPADILEAIVGVFRADADDNDPAIFHRDDGSLLVAGYVPVDELADQLGIDLPAERDYQTAAGMMLRLLQRLPKTGESASGFGWRFEVVDMDGNRIDKMLVTRAIDTRRKAR